MEALDCNAVKISVRERPFRKEYKTNAASVIFYPLPKGNTLIVNERAYTLDHVFRPDVSQKEIYESIVQPLLEKALNGFNCTALAYGQTGTGKSHTMGLNFEDIDEESSGMIPRCLRQLFNKTKENEENLQKVSEISASFIEIYNEKVYDLLIENHTEPILGKGCKFSGSTKKVLNDIETCIELVKNANKNRHVRPTKMNSQSSRSHAIFTIHLKNQTNENDCVTSFMNFVDLAGSEGVKRTGHQGLAMSEGVFINQGLLSIGKVVQAMTMGSKVIPYRDSVLSTVLQESLNTNSFLTLLACISPHKEDLSETLSTLRFAQNTKLLKHSPQVNNVLAELKRKNSLAKLNPLARAAMCNDTPFKRPHPQSKQSFPPTITSHKDQRSNTFSTPSKAKRSAEKNRCNQSDVGLTPKEKQKAIQSRIPTSMAQDYTTDRESMFESTMEPKKSLNSMAAEPLSYSPVVRKCFEMFAPKFEAKMLEIMSSFVNKNSQSSLFQTPANPIDLNTPTSESDDIISSNIPKTPKNKYKLLFATSSPLNNEADSNQNKITSSNGDGKLHELPTLRRSSRISSSFIAANSTMNELCISKNHQNADECLENPNRKVRRSLRILERSLHDNVDEKQYRRTSIKTLNESRRKYIRMSALLEKPEENTSSKKKTSQTKKLNNPIIDGYMDSEAKPLPNGSKKSNLANHRKAIMDLLNSGSMKQLQVLPQIGQKTAFQIVSYRTLNGKFKNFKQVEKLPIWRGTSWDRFAQANMLS